MKVVTAYTLIPWVIYFLLTIYLVWKNFSSQFILRFPLLMGYLCFSVLRTMGLSTVSGNVDSYQSVYWPLQGIGYMLSGVLALSLLYTATADYRRRLDIMALVALVILMPFMMAMGAGEWHPWLSTAKWADLACAFLLLWGLTMGKNWSRPYEGIAWGLMAGLAGHLCCALLQGDHNPSPLLRVGYQMAGIIQLVVWAFVLRQKASASA